MYRSCPELSSRQQQLARACATTLGFGQGLINLTHAEGTWLLGHSLRWLLEYAVCSEKPQSFKVPRIEGVIVLDAPIIGGGWKARGLKLLQTKSACWCFATGPCKQEAPKAMARSRQLGAFAL
jgi:hypothetical protein